MGNTGDVPFDDTMVIVTVPIEMTVTQVSTGGYTGLANREPCCGVDVYCEKNTVPGQLRRFGRSPDLTTNETVPAPVLGTGEYITRLMWLYGAAAPGMRAISPPTITGQVANPDNAGGPVTVGDTITSCALLRVSHSVEPWGFTKEKCGSFNLIAGPAIGVEAPEPTPLGSPVRATALLRGVAPTGSITFQAFAASDTSCANPSSPATPRSAAPARTRVLPSRRPGPARTDGWRATTATASTARARRRAPARMRCSRSSRRRTCLRASARR